MTTDESSTIVAALDLVDDADQGLAVRSLQALIDDDAELFPDEAEPVAQPQAEVALAVDPSREDLREQFMRGIAKSIGLNWDDDEKVNRVEAADVVDKAVMPLVDELLTRATAMRTAANLLSTQLSTSDKVCRNIRRMAKARDYQIDRERAESRRLRAELAAARMERPSARSGESDQVAPEVEVLALRAKDHLGYVRPSDEWTNGAGEPLPDALQDAAHALVEAGQLPEFKQFVGDGATDSWTSWTAPPVDRVDQRTSNDCLRSCVASLTSVSYEDAPDLVESPAWRTELRVWARARGGDFSFTTPAPMEETPVGRYIASGPSPRGDFAHAVVMRHFPLAGISMVHDPHPSRAGLPNGITEVITWCGPYEPVPMFRKGDPEPSASVTALIDKHGCRIERRGRQWVLAVDSAGVPAPADASLACDWESLGGAPFTDAPADPVTVWRPGIGARVILVTDEAGEYPGTVKQSVTDNTGTSPAFKFGVKWDHLADMGHHVAADLEPLTAADASSWPR